MTTTSPDRENIGTVSDEEIEAVSGGVVGDCTSVPFPGMPIIIDDGILTTCPTNSTTSE